MSKIKQSLDEWLDSVDYKELANGKYVPSQFALQFVSFIKLVNKILEQTLVPTWVLNQDIYQKAINTQAELMVTSKSEKVRAMAADSLLTHLAKPEKAGPLVNIDMTANTGLDDLKETICKLAEMQQNMIRSGKASTKEIAEQQIQEAVIDE